MKLSRLFRVSSLFIGLVLVAFGTSAPEAAVGINAVLRGYKDIALANVLGSNIANLGLILGVCALLKPLPVDPRVFRKELPFMLFSVILFYFLSLDGVLGPLDGAIFILAFVVFCALSYISGKKDFNHQETQDFKLRKTLDNMRSPALVLLVTGTSLAGIIWGADIMVRSGVRIAYWLGIRPWIIGITIFAIGTSLPELVASVTASLKKVSDIGMGNVIGSNVFNILLILGIVALIEPIPIKSSYLNFEYPVLLLFSVLTVLMMSGRKKISRVEGGVLLVLYLGFILLLIV